MVREKLKRVFEISVEIVFGIILLFIVLSISIGAIQLFRDLLALLTTKGMTEHYINLISDVLTLYVLVELSRSLLEYFNTQKFRLLFIVDAALIFIVREILIGLFKHTLQPDMIYALAILLLVLGIIRLGCIVTHQREKKLLEECKN